MGLNVIWDIQSKYFIVVESWGIFFFTLFFFYKYFYKENKEEEFLEAVE